MMLDIKGAATGVAAAAHRRQWLAVRPIVLARRGGSGSMWQGMVQVACDGAWDEESSPMGHVMGT